MEKTLGELAALVGGELRGPADLKIRGLAPVDRATPEDLTFIAHPRFARLGEATQAGAVIVSPQWADLDKPLIVVEQPYLAYARDKWAARTGRWRTQEATQIGRAHV